MAQNQIKFIGIWQPQGWIAQSHKSRPTPSHKVSANVRNGEEILPKVSTSCVRSTNVTDDRQTTHGFAIVKTRVKTHTVKLFISDTTDVT